MGKLCIVNLLLENVKYVCKIAQESKMKWLNTFCEFLYAAGLPKDNPYHIMMFPEIRGTYVLYEVTEDGIIFREVLDKVIAKKSRFIPLFTYYYWQSNYPACKSCYYAIYAIPQTAVEDAAIKDIIGALTNVLNGNRDAPWFAPMGVRRDVIDGMQTIVNEVSFKNPSIH